MIIKWFTKIFKSKIIRIEMERKYFDGIISSTCTSTPCFYWTGYKYCKWLCFNWKRKMHEIKDFEVFGSQLEFKFVIPSGVECIITYTK